MATSTVLPARSAAVTSASTSFSVGTLQRGTRPFQAQETSSEVLDETVATEQPARGH